MRQCTHCGGRLKRTHRSCLQRLGYVALYTCPDCHHVEFIPRFGYRLGHECRCPRCGTSRLTKLRERDHIDRMQSGLWNLAAWICGGRLYHCCFCRLQFYDRRPLPAIKEPETLSHPTEARTA